MACSTKPTSAPTASTGSIIDRRNHQLRPEHRRIEPALRIVLTAGQLYVANFAGGAPATLYQQGHQCRRREQLVRDGNQQPAWPAARRAQRDVLRLELERQHRSASSAWPARHDADGVLQRPHPHVIVPEPTSGIAIAGALCCALPPRRGCARRIANASIICLDNRQRGRLDSTTRSLRCDPAGRIFRVRHRMRGAAAFPAFRSFVRIASQAPAAAAPSPCPRPLAGGWRLTP